MHIVFYVRMVSCRPVASGCFRGRRKGREGDHDSGIQIFLITSRNPNWPRRLRDSARSGRTGREPERLPIMRMAGCFVRRSGSCATEREGAYATRLPCLKPPQLYLLTVSICSLVCFHHVALPTVLYHWHDISICWLPPTNSRDVCASTDVSSVPDSSLPALCSCNRCDELWGCLAISSWVQLLPSAATAAGPHNNHNRP